MAWYPPQSTLRTDHPFRKKAHGLFFAPQGKRPILFSHFTQRSKQQTNRHVTLQCPRWPSRQILWRLLVTCWRRKTQKERPWVSHAHNRYNLLAKQSPRRFVGWNYRCPWLRWIYQLTGDDVKLDLLSNDVFVNSSSSLENFAFWFPKNQRILAIEEALQGVYCVATDPLDGSSNIDCNVSTGTIFGVYKRMPGNTPGTEDVLRPGKELIAAGYCMYGSSTQLVLTTGNGVNGFTLDPSIGEFLLTHPNIKIPEKPKTVYSVNEGNSRYWDAATKKFVTQVKSDGKKPYSLRYVGSMVWRAQDFGIRWCFYVPWW